MTLDVVETIAEGLGSSYAGEYPFAVVKEYVERVILVDDNQIVRAMGLLIEPCKLVVEPAGAASLAGLMFGNPGLPMGAKVVCILSGVNIDLARLKNLL